MRWKINLNPEAFFIAEKRGNNVIIEAYPPFIKSLVYPIIRGNRIIFSIGGEVFAEVKEGSKKVVYSYREDYSSDFITQREFISIEMRNLIELYNNMVYKRPNTVYEDNQKHFSAVLPSSEVHIRTELHTHFLEMLNGLEFLDIVSKFTDQILVVDGVVYGPALKGEEPIEVDKIRDLVSIEGMSELDDTDPEKRKYLEYASQLSLDVNGQVPFSELTRISKRRSAVIDTAAEAYVRKSGYEPNEETMATCRGLIYIEILKKAMKELEYDGIEYVEFSFSTKNTIIKLMDYVNEHPKFFEGIRFKPLFSMARRVPAPKLVRKNLNAFAALIKDDYVQGFDLMGEETGLTEADIHNLDVPTTFISIIKGVLEILNGREDKVLRLHAGENMESRYNPLYSLRVIDRLCKQFGYTAPQIRIGHGLHCVQYYTEEQIKEYLHLLREYKVIVEINATSNFTLSNIDKISSIPFNWYANNDIPIVLATDGAGMYLTSAEQERIIALLFGNRKVLVDVANTEESVLSR